jgi:hypothetical protein
MTIIAHGALQHHFWGTYAASIALKFATPELAAQAAPLLAPFTQSDRVPSALVFHGSGAALKAAEATLKAHGADMKKVSSIRYSIDRGEPFTIEVDLTPADTSVQLSLLS